MARSMLDPFGCPVCLTGTVACTCIAYEVTMRGRVQTVPDAELMQCDACGEIFFAPGQIDALHRKAADAIRPDVGLLTGREIVDFRKSLDLTQAELEKAMGVPPKTVARWEIGCVFQSRAADRFLRVLMAHPSLVEELMVDANIHGGSDDEFAEDEGRPAGAARGRTRRARRAVRA